MATALGNITQMPKIPGITPQTQPIEPGAVYSQQIEALQPKLEDVRTRAGAAERERGALASEEKAFGAEQAVKRAEGMAGAQEKFAKTMREAPMRPELEEKVKQEQDFFFQPGQRDGMQLATLASLMMVLGTSIGKGGKGNAMAALSGLNGMMEGYRKRSDELYKQEKGQFESNAKALKDQITALRQAMQDYEKQASVDKQGALQNLEIELARQGADFLKQRVERQGVANLLPELQRQEKQLQTQMDQYSRKLADAQNRAQEAKVRAEEARQRELDRQAFAAGMQRERLATQRDLQKERTDAALQKAQSATKEQKPPPKEIQQLNTNRNILIPALESALPVLDRLNKSGQWTTMTTLLGLPKGTNIAEAAFRDDPEAIQLIRTFSKFRAGEFETAGKALTKMENQILAPLFQADFRTYEGIRNAVSEGLNTLKKEQRSIEAAYPWVKTFNDAYRSDFGASPSSAAPAAGPYSDQEKERRYQEWKARQGAQQ